MPVTPKQVDTWKEIHRDVYKTEVTDDEGNVYEVYFKKPNIKVMSASSKMNEKESTIAGAMVFYDNCKLYADEEIDKNDELKLSVALDIAQTFKIYSTNVKKL